MDTCAAENCVPVNILKVPFFSLPNASMFFLSNLVQCRRHHPHEKFLPDIEAGNVLYDPVYKPTYTATNRPCHECLRQHGAVLIAAVKKYISFFLFQTHWNSLILKSQVVNT